MNEINDPELSPEVEKVAQRYLNKLKGSEPMEMERRVFLCYSRKDYDEVWKFHLAILGSGLHSFFDQSELMGIRLGENWMERIFEMLSKCTTMAYFLTPHSIQSDFIRYEVGFFIERIRIRSGAFFAIVLLQDMEIGSLKELNVPIIEYYKMSAEDAVHQLIKEMISFYGRE